jgi:peroxiredoxin
VNRILVLSLLSCLLEAQRDPVFEAYKAWDLQHPRLDPKARIQSLLEVSSEWVKRWPDSKLAWEERRNALVGSQSASAELWKEVDENLIRLKPAHTFASIAAYDWVTAKVNLQDAETLIASEIEWLDSRPRPTRSTQPTLADVIDEAQFSSGIFSALCTLASAQIQRREFDSARATIGRLRNWLDGDFNRNFDQDPLEVFPDYQAKHFILSAQLAEAEGRNMDALASYQQVVANPYFRREYQGFVAETHSLWNRMGGTGEGWLMFSKIPPLPAGVPSGHSGISFLPWTTLDYKLPQMKLPSLDSLTWTKSDFEGKTTFVYLWASWCGPCWPNLPAIQALYDTTKDRRDIQVVTLSVDEDQAKLATFMKEKKYTFPVMVGKAYTDALLPRMILGQTWIVDRTGSIRLQRTSNNFSGREQAEVDEAVYKLLQVSSC